MSPILNPSYPGALHYPINKTVSNFVIRDHFVSDQIAEAITDGTITESMDVASNVVFNIQDPTRELLHSGLLKQWVNINPPVYKWVNGRRRKISVPGEWDEIYGSLDGRDLALSSVAKTGNQFDLTFENRAVHELRKITKPKTWYRDVMTRAQVIKATCDEVKTYHIQLFSPELQTIQPIATSADQLSATDVKALKHKGFAPKVRITVKHVAATPQQVNYIERVLHVGASMSASYKVLLSAIMTITQESDVSIIHGAGGVGLFSQLAQWGWPATGNVEVDAAAYFKVAIQNNLQQPQLTPGQLAQSVQRSAYPTAYDQWESEAKATLQAWGSNAQSSSVTLDEYNRYAFQRGKDGEEDSWTFDKRLADEVGWRLFAVNNWLEYVEDNQLLNQKPYDSISESDDAIDTIDYNIDQNKPITQCTVECHVDRWMSPPGSVCEIEDDSPVHGKWLVYEIRYPLFSNKTEVTLQLPTPPKPEPAPDTSTVTISVPRSGSGQSSAALQSATDALAQVSQNVPGHPELQPGISRVVNLLRRQFPQLIITSTTSGTHATNSYHYLGRACDLACDQTAMDQIGAWIQQNIRGILTEGIHNPTLSVKFGQIVSASFWGSTTWSEHVNHIHVAV